MWTPDCKPEVCRPNPGGHERVPGPTSLAGWGLSSLGDGEQRGLGCNIPDLDAFVQ